jgi:hypothetical protein
MGYILLCVSVLAEYGWYRYHVLVRSLFLFLYLFDILLCVVLKGHKSLPSIRTKLHAELHTTLCVKSWQIIVGTGTTCWCVYFYLLTPLCVVLKGSKPLPSIRTKLHVMLSYYSVCAVFADYCWYQYYVLVHSAFLCLFLFVYTIMCGVEGVQTITLYTY